MERGGRSRGRMLATVHAAKRDLGLDDAAYRSLLAGAAGVESAADLATPAQHQAVLQAFRAAGWSPGRLTGQWSTCYALWQRIHEEGGVRNGSYRALRAYVERRLGAQDIYRTDQLRSVIEGLKRWRARLAS